MRPLRVLSGLVVAIALSSAPAQAGPDDPFVVYTANREVSGPVVVRADSPSGALTEISRNGPQGRLFVHPYDLAVERDGSLLVVDMGQFAVPRTERVPDGAVIRVDPASGEQHLVTKGGSLVDPAAIAVAPDGMLFVAENVGLDGRPAVIRIDPATGAQEILTEGDRLCNPFGIAREASGDLVVADYGDLVDASGRTIVNCPIDAGSLVRVGGAGRQSVLSQGGLFGSPFGVTVDAAGAILVANEMQPAAGVAAVDPVSGEQAVVTPNAADDLLRLPERVAVAPNGDLLLTDFQLENGNGGVVGVARADGRQRARWQGEPFDNPLGIAVVANRAPAAVLRVTPAVVAGDAPVVFDAGASSDPEGQRMRYDWDLDGDGLWETRSASATVQRTFGASGFLSARVRASDPHGGRAVASAPLTVDADAPLLADFAASGRTLIGRRPRGEAPDAAAESAITFSYRVSERARVDIGLARARPGRRAGARCVAPGRRPVRRRDRCTRWRRAVTLGQLAAAGPNRLRFSGRVGGRRLAPGRYRASAVALDQVNNRSARSRLFLRVVAPRRDRLGSQR